MRSIQSSIAIITFFCAALMLAGCHSHDGEGHGQAEHAQEEGGHDDDHDDHGADGAIVVTHFTEETELFTEYPPLKPGEVSEWAAHITILEDYQPLRKGTVTVKLTGGDKPAEEFSAGPSSPGIFRVKVKPEHAGPREMTVSVRAGDLQTDHVLGSVKIGGEPHESKPVPPEGHDHVDGHDDDHGHDDDQGKDHDHGDTEHGGHDHGHQEDKTKSGGSIWNPSAALKSAGKKDEEHEEHHRDEEHEGQNEDHGHDEDEGDNHHADDQDGHGHGDHGHGDQHHGHGEPEGITFLKEQQWKMEFNVAEARIQKIRPSFEAYGEIVSRPDGHSHVTAPLPGRVVSGADFPELGSEVAVGDVMLSLTPVLSDMGDDAALDQAASQARIDLNLATSERKRLESLFEAGAIPERRLIEAKAREASARSALTGARRRQGQVRDVESSEGDGASIEVRAQMAGTVVEMDVAGGQFVRAGDEMMLVMDLDPIWLKVQVSETHASQLSNVKGAWFKLEGFPDIREVEESSLVTVGSVLDHESRTIPVYFEVPNPKKELRVGMFADVHVIRDQPRRAVAVPMSAIVHEAGVPVVYVMLGGETFERRPVRVGERDGNMIEIEDGLHAGERVVSEGAYAVRLAASGNEVPDHGHGH